MESKRQNLSTVPISVLVPFRNEETNLPKLIASLEKQMHTRFEVIFVNDHSDDNGEVYLAKRLSNVSFPVKILSLDLNEGKKSALALALSHAAYDLVITTDADCEMGADWLQSMARPFADEGLKMLVGPIGLTGKSLWQQMQSIESSALIGVGASMLQLGKPIMANGANLAYRKAVFQEVNGFQGIDATPSGDDELLMAKVVRKYPADVAFIKSSEAMVFTDALSSWSDFSQQRLRWASKWKVGKRMSTQWSALFIFVIQLIQLTFIGILFSEDALSTVTLILLMTRLLIELILLWSVRQSLGQKMHWLPAIISYLLYPVYAIYFGVAANFGTFQWKGRSYKINGVQ